MSRDPPSYDPDVMADAKAKLRRVMRTTIGKELAALYEVIVDVPIGRISRFDPFRHRHVLRRVLVNENVGAARRKRVLKARGLHTF